MSEQNILNPDVASELNPDWGYKVRNLSVYSRFQPKSGKPVTRMIEPRGRQFALGWANRPRAVADQLLQWDEQYRGDFFTYYDIDRGRYYSGQFIEPLMETPNENDQVTIEGIFEEIQGVPLYQYPGDFTRDGVFIEERDGFGNTIVELTGDWVFEPHANAHAGNNYFSFELDATAQWDYFGYGFQVWSRKQSNLGIVEIISDGVSFGNFDLYSAVAQPSAAIAQFNNRSLKMHSVKLRCTHTKNAASSDYNVYADAIRVIR